MGLSYYYKFKAEATVTPDQLRAFLKKVGQHATTLGFGPTTVLDVAFDNRERRNFALRLGGHHYIEDDRLKGAAVPCEEDACRHDRVTGGCRLVPRQAVVLVLTDEKGCETCFGFMRFPPRSEE